MKSKKRAYSLSEAAEELGVKPQTFYNYRSTKQLDKLPKIHKIGGKIIIYSEDLEFFREQNEEINDQIA